MRIGGIAQKAIRLGQSGKGTRLMKPRIPTFTKQIWVFMLKMKEN